MPPLHKNFFVHCKNWIHPNWRCWITAHKRITVGGPDGHKVANEKCAEAFREILPDNQCWGLVVRDGGRDPPQQEQGELQWAKLILVAARLGQKVSLLVLGQEYMATNGFDAHPSVSHVFPHLPCEGEGSISATAPSLCSTALCSRAGEPTWLLLYAKINVWSSRICCPFTGWCRLGKCACQRGHMLLFRNISKPWTLVEQMHMILFWQPRIVLQMELTFLYGSSKCCPAQGRSSPITGSIKCAMKVVICVTEWPTEDMFLQVLPGDPHPTEMFLTHTEIMSLLTRA